MDKLLGRLQELDRRQLAAYQKLDSLFRKQLELLESEGFPSEKGFEELEVIIAARRDCIANISAREEERLEVVAEMREKGLTVQGSELRTQIQELVRQISELDGLIKQVSLAGRSRIVQELQRIRQGKQGTRAYNSSVVQYSQGHFIDRKK